MAGDAVAPASDNRSENGRVVRRRVNKYTYNDKENFNVFGGNVGENQKKSPLPVGYPRKPLNDITAILQSLDDQSEEGCTRPRKPFTRSQNLGKCSSNNGMLETIDRTGSETCSSKKSKGKTKVLAASSTAATTSSIGFTFSFDTHGQENLEPATRSRAEKKTKTVTFAEADSFTANVHHELSLPKVRSEDEPSLGVISTVSGMSEAGEVRALVREENKTSAVAVNTTGDTQQETKSEYSFASTTMDEGERTPRLTMQSDRDVEVKENTVSVRAGNQRARVQRQQKTLSNRSSVAKFR